MESDGTLHNRVERDGRDKGRGSSQTHGGADPSGVDAAPDGDEIHPETRAEPPSASHT